MTEPKKVSGHLRKMAVQATNPVSYSLVLEQDGNTNLVPINEFIGKNIALRYKGVIHCIECGRQTKTSFQQGFCFPCTRKLACCDSCIVKPELCHFHKGTCRQPEWGEKNCMIPHVVYLANSSGLKVGITRESQVPTRWLDQGAMQALPLAKVTTRLQSGLVEITFKDHVADKTNWRALLKGNAEKLDLVAERERLLGELGTSTGEALAKMINSPHLDPSAITLLPQERPVEFTYPVLQYPEKIVSIDLEKKPEWEAELWGIKGQYLITSIGVINMRKYAGYLVEVELS